MFKIIETAMIECPIIILGLATAIFYMYISRYKVSLGISINVGKHRYSKPLMKDIGHIRELRYLHDCSPTLYSNYLG